MLGIVGIIAVLTVLGISLVVTRLATVALTLGELDTRKADVQGQRAHDQSVSEHRLHVSEQEEKEKKHRRRRGEEKRRRSESEPG